MKRVLVVGSPGAGKTLFAKRLAKKTGLPLVHLDTYYHDKTKDYYSEQNKPAWRAKVMELIKPNTWIIDGNYSSTFPDRFERADTIFFLDYPLHTRLRGVFNRRLEYRNRKREDMPEDWQEKIDWSFLEFVWNFKKNYRHKITDVLKTQSSKKIVIFKKRSEATKYLKML